MNPIANKKGYGSNGAQGGGGGGGGPQQQLKSGIGGVTAMGGALGAMGGGIGGGGGLGVGGGGGLTGGLGQPFGGAPGQEKVPSAGRRRGQPQPGRPQPELEAVDPTAPQQLQNRDALSAGAANANGGALLGGPLSNSSSVEPKRPSRERGRAMPSVS